MTVTQPHTWALDATWRTLLKDLGIAPGNALRRAGLADDLLQQPAQRLPSEAYYRLWRGIEAECGDPLFPIRLCEAIRSESFSPPLFAALCSPNLLVAAQRIARYKRLVAPLQFEVTERHDVVRIALHWLDAPLAPPASLVMMELLFCLTLARMGTREHVRAMAVETPHPPAPLRPYEAFLGCRVRVGERRQITFARSDALRPFLTSNDAMWSAFEPELRQRLADLEGTAPTAQRVRAALLEGLPSGQVSMEAISRKLALSTRTLQRRIEAEGATYQQILQATREELARHYLQQTTLPIAEIAFLLGFNEPTSFSRAFRAWTGSTPDTMRHRAGVSDRGGGHGPGIPNLP